MKMRGRDIITCMMGLTLLSIPQLAGTKEHPPIELPGITFTTFEVFMDGGNPLQIGEGCRALYTALVEPPIPGVFLWGVHDPDGALRLVEVSGNTVVVEGVQLSPIPSRATVAVTFIATEGDPPTSFLIKAAEVIVISAFYDPIAGPFACFTIPINRQVLGIKFLLEADAEAQLKTIWNAYTDNLFFLGVDAADALLIDAINALNPNTDMNFLLVYYTGRGITRIESSVDRDGPLTSVTKVNPFILARRAGEASYGIVQVADLTARVFAFRAGASRDDVVDTVYARLRDLPTDDFAGLFRFLDQELTRDPRSDVLKSFQMMVGLMEDTRRLVGLIPPSPGFGELAYDKESVEILAVGHNRPASIASGFTLPDGTRVRDWDLNRVTPQDTRDYTRIVREYVQTLRPLPDHVYP